MQSRVISGNLGLSRRPVDVHRRRVAVAATRDEAEEAGEAEAVVSVRVRHKDAVDAPN